jgi:hypothetical protein
MVDDTARDRAADYFDMWFKGDCGPKPLVDALTAAAVERFTSLTQMGHHEPAPAATPMLPSDDALDQAILRGGQKYRDNKGSGSVSGHVVAELRALLRAHCAEPPAATPMLVGLPTLEALHVAIYGGVTGVESSPEGRTLELCKAARAEALDQHTKLVGLPTNTTIYGAVRKAMQRTNQPDEIAHQIIISYEAARAEALDAAVKERVEARVAPLKPLVDGSAARFQNGWNTLLGAILGDAAEGGEA